MNCVDTEEAAFRQIVFEVENGTVDVYRQPLKAGMGNPASQTLDVETGSAIFTQDETHGVVANATRFFRETRSFRALEQLIVPEHMANTPQQRFTLWSAACSRGAEAYSYAMYLVNLLSAYPAPCPFHVLATDINASLVEKAREGVFKPSRTDLDRYKAVFSRHGMIDGDVLTFGDEIKRHITFKSFDLKQAPKKQFRFRVIICANMFQYYEDDARAHFLTNLVSALDRPGYLYVGALSAPMAEQFGLHRISEFGIYRVG